MTRKDAEITAGGCEARDEGGREEGREGGRTQGGV